MVKLKSIVLRTRAEFQMIKITEDVRAFIAESGVKNGLAAVITAHTTTGIMVNEGLECVETDIEETLERLIPKDAPYAHAHFLPSYGATGSNSPSHLKSMLSGNNCLFVVQDGQMVTGDAQDVYLAEFDGPKARKVYIQIIGE
ncbi:secondary thiamine-phosphate synthase enzyme [Paenibacillus sp. UNCCL117]|uniref:secondary thiamine-phosphate synthase enzyme YjbQ n=1 Tax=unclassified Paenibacillus TaxID=185978 RepID=UPI00088E5FE8|nr:MULTISPECIES: secondary thiamine-phosphate synthase enzyme YjbQ [unclassified Paenibacillus]SDD96103.1 secondary thiamine-phosphate synthase enzyme [Paenibacillus sp. cl123]SFW56462.1 secondary thiamine-phosphate synthase enzyme [Paenibacillus sp. UNCCL117]